MIPQVECPEAPECMYVVCMYVCVIYVCMCIWQQFEVVDVVGTKLCVP